jgi:hypothetical protein
MTILLRRIILAAPVLALLAVSFLPVPVRGAEFLSLLEDVPVMPGFSEDAAAAVAFDTASGRIVTARITGRKRPGVDLGALLAFYGASLPALGWRAESPVRFRRDGETLTLRVEVKGDAMALGFDLRPE